MIEEKAKYIIGEIKSISRYEKIIDSLTIDLRDLADQMESIQLPSSPQGRKIVAPTVSPQEKTSRIHELLSEEQELMAERSRFEQRKHQAVKYRAIFFDKCPDNEQAFSQDFFNGKSYKYLEYHHSVSNPYRHMLRMVKSLL